MVPVGRLDGKGPGNRGSTPKQNRPQSFSLKPVARHSGGDELEHSPLPSFVFCYLAAHFVTDLLDQEAVENLMDMCVERRGELAALIGGGV